MTFKVKYMLFGKIAILLCLCLVLNNTFMMKSYADESIAAQNPLFIPINTFVTAALIGSGIIAKNSQEALDAGSQLVNNIISQIKSSEVEKSEANPDYDSPFRVINGGKSEKPNNDNKNGKWFAAAAGALATHEIYASKDAVKDIMSKANSLGGYNSFQNVQSYISLDDIVKMGSASNISLQLAKISNSCVSQWDAFLHSSFWSNKDVNIDDCVFTCVLYLPDVFSSSSLYPRMEIRVVEKSDSWFYWKLVRNNLSYGKFSNKFGSANVWYINDQYQTWGFFNRDYIQANAHLWQVHVNPRSSSQDFNWSYDTSSAGYNDTILNVTGGSTGVSNGYFGPVNKEITPWQFTQNIYNVNMSFDENFQNWLQGQIQGLGNQLIDAVRLGITSVSPSWNPNQEQIQAGTSPDNVIYQFINNYENPENIPDDETQPDPDPDPEPSPEPTPEPVPNDEYLGSFLLPESITTKFPFCIPFDVVRCLRLFSTSDREAPRWECDIGYGSSKYHVVIDLSMFNDVASFIRPLEYILFLVGLAIGTRSLIRG